MSATEKKTHLLILFCFTHRKHFQTHGPLWHIAWQPWNGEGGAESHHYCPAIIMSLAWCLSMCHLSSHLRHPSVARGWDTTIHHLLGLLVCYYSLKSQSTLQQWCPTMCHGWSRDCSFLFQPVALAAVPARDAEIISKITWCSLWKETLQTLGPSRGLFAHHSTWCPTYSVITVKPPTTQS